MTTAANDFLPEGYETPESAGNYMKFETGDNELRILSKAVMGWMYWSKDSKPVRLEFDPAGKPDIDKSLIKPDKQGRQDLKFFWALVVYNYKLEAIQILEIPQVSILKPIEDYAKSPKWGSPFKYDLNIKKSIDGDRTNYMVTANPPTPVSEAVKAAFIAKGKINLAALFNAGDPFAPVPGEEPEAPKVPAAEADPIGAPTDDLPF